MKDYFHGRIAEMAEGFPTALFMVGRHGPAISCRKSDRFTGPIPPLQVGDGIRFSLIGLANFTPEIEILNLASLEKVATPVPV